ncbi:hypothetical protein DMENIID0001_037650 [Sergentomyia squamirostris]
MAILQHFLHRFREGRIPGLKAFAAILNWIWPRDRCTNCNSIYTLSLSDIEERNSLRQIHRAPDGRFVLADDAASAVEEQESFDVVDAGAQSDGPDGSQYSSSDDGGFLPRRSRGRASWRRPLVISPSQLSSDGSGLSRYGSLLGRAAPLLMPATRPPLHQNLHISTISGPGTLPYTPASRISRFHATSSPATSSTAGVTSPWSPLYFSDLSSVRQSSAERSLPAPMGSLRYLQDRHFHELPALRTIHEETARMARGFVPVGPPSPHWRGYHYLPQTHHTYRPSRGRFLPRQWRARSAPDLASPLSYRGMGIEASPESRSSSSGFGSKNTSTQQNQSSQSGGSDWRFLPPYRPPPPPPSALQHLSGYTRPLRRPPTPPTYSMSHWLDLVARLNSASEQANLSKSVDVGSVDGHYEFDPSTPTPTASTPTGPPAPHLLQLEPFSLTSALPTAMTSMGPSGRKRVSRYDNIEARVQAMKEEFYAYRQRQAMRRAGVELESAC